MTDKGNQMYKNINDSETNKNSQIVQMHKRLSHRKPLRELGFQSKKMIVGIRYFPAALPFYTPANSIEPPLNF